jgi:hypothetical protein
MDTVLDCEQLRDGDSHEAHALDLSTSTQDDDAPASIAVAPTPPHHRRTGQLPTHTKKPYKELTLVEKVELIRLAERQPGLSQAAIAERYEIAKSNVCRILQRRAEYLTAFESDCYGAHRKRKLKSAGVNGTAATSHPRRPALTASSTVRVYDGVSDDDDNDDGDDEPNTKRPTTGEGERH